MMCLHASRYSDFRIDTREPGATDGDVEIGKVLQHVLQSLAQLGAWWVRPKVGTALVD